MSSMFRLDSSIRIDGSVTRAVADTIENVVSEELPGVDVVRRDVATTPVGDHWWGDAAFAGGIAQSERTADQEAALAVAAELADELVGADVLLFAVPMYNYGVSQHFKTWFDLVLTDQRFTPGAQPLAGKPAFLVTARGGGYGPGTPRAGWDHATGWLRRMLEELWGLDLDVIETELTLAEVTPAMAELRELARRQLAESHEAARQGARSVTLRLRPSAPPAPRSLAP